MSLKNYNRLPQDPSLLGCKRPQLQTADFSACAQRVDLTAVCQAVNELNTAHSWQMLADRVELNALLTQESQLIEGEWRSCDGVTLKAKLLGGREYLLTQMRPTDDGLTKVYREQEIWLRSNLRIAEQINIARYRYWWALSDEQNPGLWLPYAAQFIGFGYRSEVANRGGEGNE